MKKKPLVHYLELVKSALNQKEWSKAKRAGEFAVKKLSKLSYSPLEEWFLYCRLGFAYNELGEYSRSLSIYYKANLVASKNHLNPSYIAYTSLSMGYNLMRLNNINQALFQFQKTEQYYQKYGNKIFPMDKRNYFNMYIFLGDCYLANNRLKNVKEIIEKILYPLLDSVLKDIVFGNYYSLKGEYLMAMKEYAQAREAFQEGIKAYECLGFHSTTIEPKIFLATMDLLEGNLDAAIRSLTLLLKETRDLKLNEFICEVGLLLSKCYSLQNRPNKVISIEKKIKSLLVKLDVVWLYEKTKEFEKLYHQLQPIYQTATKSVPTILTNTINYYYNNSSYKDIIIGQSPSMREIYQIIEKVAPTDLPVLIQGETGTGKELIARAIHHTSLRKEKHWLALNCGAIPETLLENELLGHVKGAFTDARDDRKGYIELASNGTLFVDEIAEMSLSMQQKLLRVLDEKLVWRLGAEKPISINTRFIFASNQNIEDLVKRNLFRSELFHRINTIISTLPPLRNRKEDIPLLITHFLAKYFHPSSLAPIFSSEALSCLQSYFWPGNVRELENELKRICALYPNVKQITESMISENIRNYRGIPDLALTSLKEARKLAEKNLIISSIKKSNGNILQASYLLGCSQRYLYQKVKQLKVNLKTILVTKQ